MPGRVRSPIRVQQAATDAALEDYQLIVLTALEDVEDPLGALRQEFVRRETLEAEVESCREAPRRLPELLVADLHKKHLLAQRPYAPPTAGWIISACFREVAEGMIITHTPAEWRQNTRWTRRVGARNASRHLEMRALISEPMRAGARTDALT
jgi:hypothetical protein